MTTPARPEVAVIASAVALPSQGGAPAKRFRVVPFGTFQGRDGRGPWHLRDRAHAERVIAATKAFLNGVDVLINYDHQSEYSAVPGVGGQAKAAGWIDPDTLEVGSDGIYAAADWTEPAEAALQAREYRYYSPHFRADRRTGELTRIVNVGLTNSPNIEVSALASQEPGASPAEGKSMSLAKLLSATALSAFGLTAESDDEAAINAIDAFVSDSEATSASLNAVREKLELDDDADESAICSAIAASGKAGEPDPAKFVPIGALKEVQTELGVIREERVLAAVDAAIEEGKLTPAQKDWAVKLGKQDMGELNSFLGTAPVFKGGKVVEGKPDATASKLTDEESTICSAMGWSEDEFLEQKKKEAA